MVVTFCSDEVCTSRRGGKWFHKPPFRGMGDVLLNVDPTNISATPLLRYIDGDVDFALERIDRHLLDC
jgi:hypothetical protein